MVLSLPRGRFHRPNDRLHAQRQKGYEGRQTVLPQDAESSQTSIPRVINVDRNNAYPPAVEELKEEGVLAVTSQLRQCKYLNNIVEQDHRFIKRRVNPGL